MVEASPDLRRPLTDPRLPLERRHRRSSTICSADGPPRHHECDQLVVAAGRGGDLPDIADELVSLAAATRERAVAEVRTAVPLDDAT